MLFQYFESGIYRQIKLSSKESISLLRGQFEGAYYNTQVGELCAVSSKVRTKQGHELINE